MNRKLNPQEAFTIYMGLGDGRSYEAVAKHFQVSKKSVTNLATKDKWQDRLERIESEARQRTDEKAVETLEQMNDRHLKVLKFIEARAIETIKSLPLASAMDAVRAYTMAAEKERLIRGEPSERVNIEEIIKRETKNWVVPEDEASEGAAVR